METDLIVFAIGVGFFLWYLCMFLAAFMVPEKEETHPTMHPVEL